MKYDATVQTLLTICMALLGVVVNLRWPCWRAWCALSSDRPMRTG